MDNPFSKCSNYYQRLPKLDPGLFTGDFSWLTELPESMEPYSMTADHSDYLGGLITSAGLLNLKLPDPFLLFFKDFSLQEQIISNMDCYFQLSENIYKSPFGDGGFFIEFMHDGQDLAIWNLYLHPENWHRVVETPFQWDNLPLDDFSLEEIFVRTHVCAPTFEEFIYRNWIENMIWFLSYKDLPLSEEMEKYLEELKERKYES